MSVKIPSSASPYESQVRVVSGQRSNVSQLRSKRRIARHCKDDKPLPEMPPTSARFEERIWRTAQSHQRNRSERKTNEKFHRKVQRDKELGSTDRIHSNGNARADRAGRSVNAFAKVAGVDGRVGRSRRRSDALHETPGKDKLEVPSIIPSIANPFMCHTQSALNVLQGMPTLNKINLPRCKRFS